MSGLYPCQIEVPHPAITSVTTSTGGPYAVSGGVFTCTSDAEATILCAQYNNPQIVSTNQATGVAVVKIPPNLTSITINGNAYNNKGTSGQLTTLSGLLPADASALCYNSDGFDIASAPAAS